MIHWYQAQGPTPIKIIKSTAIYYWLGVNYVISVKITTIYKLKLHTIYTYTFKLQTIYTFKFKLYLKNTNSYYKFIPK